MVAPTYRVKLPCNKYVVPTTPINAISPFEWRLKFPGPGYTHYEHDRETYKLYVGSSCSASSIVSSAVEFRLGVLEKKQTL